MQQDWRRLKEQLRAASYLLAVEGRPGSIARELDDENPVIPLGIDIDRDVATAALLSWSEQDSGWVPSLWTASIDQPDGDWMPYGLAGGLPPADYPLTDRRAASPEGLHIRLYSLPNLEQGSGRRPSPAWLSAAVRVTAEVDRIRVGERVLEVPFHGYVPIAVRNPENAVVTAFGDGSQLDTLDLRRDGGDLYRELRRRDPDSWPLNLTGPEIAPLV
jgi:hypothetical protein